MNVLPELILGLAVWYAHTTTSLDASIDPYQQLFFAAQDSGAWNANRTPDWYLVTVGGASVLAQRRDITRSRYQFEFSPALCEALGLDFGWTSSGIPYGKWPAQAERRNPPYAGRYLHY